MADTFQGFDFQAKTFPFRQALGFEQTSYSGVPWGQAIVNENFATIASGTGNTSTMNIDIGLPTDYVSLLRSCHFQCYDTGTIGWTQGVFGLAYQQPGGPYKTSVATFPEKEYLWYYIQAAQQASIRDRFASSVAYRNFVISHTGNTAYLEDALVDSITDIPLWIPPQSDLNLQQRSAIIYLENDVTGSPTNDFTLNMVFDLYTLEQAYAANVMSSPRVFS